MQEEEEDLSEGGAGHRKYLSLYPLLKLDNKSHTSANPCIQGSTIAPALCCHFLRQKRTIAMARVCISSEGGLRWRAGLSEYHFLFFLIDVSSSFDPN